jgi:hypothetical protein
MSTDLEDRLRQMYTAVAEQTVVDDPPPADLDSTHRVMAEQATRRRRRPVLAVALVIVVLAVVAVLVTRRGGTAPAGPMENRPFVIPMWLPVDMGLDGTALADVEPVTGFDPSAPAFTTQLTYHGAGGRIVWINSIEANDLTATPTGETALLADGTVAQWDADPLPRLTWTLPTGQAVLVQGSGPEVSEQELTDIASSLWYVDRATWNSVTAKVGYASGVFQTWRIPGAGTSVDLVAYGSLRTGLTLRVGSWGMGYQARPEECTASAPNVGDAVVYATGASASAAIATGPDGEVVDVSLTMAPGLPMFRWGATAFPGATAQWLNATDHSKGCTAVTP